MGERRDQKIRPRVNKKIMSRMRRKEGRDWRIETCRKTDEAEKEKEKKEKSRKEE
jgi:hypothetical protein